MDEPHSTIELLDKYLVSFPLSQSHPTLPFVPKIVHPQQDQGKETEKYSKYCQTENISKNRNTQTECSTKTVSCSVAPGAISKSQQTESSDNLLQDQLCDVFRRCYDKMDFVRQSLEQKLSGMEQKLQLLHSYVTYSSRVIRTNAFQQNTFLLTKKLQDEIRVLAEEEARDRQLIERTAAEANLSIFSSLVRLCFDIANRKKTLSNASSELESENSLAHLLDDCRIALED